MNGRRRLAVGIGLALVSVVLQCEASGAVSDLLLNLEPRCEGIHPTEYYVRGGRLLSLAEPQWRASEDEPFVTGGPGGRFTVPARNVKNGRVRVQIRYQTLFFPHPHTAWVSGDTREALSVARTLFSHEGQAWAHVEGNEIVFDEKTDEVAQVSYQLEGGKRIDVPAVVDRVPLASTPAYFTIFIRTPDGRTTDQRIERTAEGSYEPDFMHGHYAR
jgi:hypothetical protein